MEIVITEWALQSYLDLKKGGVFTDAEYWQQLRPDVELLRDGVPSPNPKFKLPGFWGPATDKSGNVIAEGFKMKWHNIGPGKVQLRLAVALVQSKAFLCQAFVKDSEATDKREAAKLKDRIRKIYLGTFVYRGSL